MMCGFSTMDCSQLHFELVSDSMDQRINFAVYVKVLPVNYFPTER